MYTTTFLFCNYVPWSLVTLTINFDSVYFSSFCPYPFTGLFEKYLSAVGVLDITSFGKSKRPTWNRFQSLKCRLSETFISPSLLQELRLPHLIITKNKNLYGHSNAICSPANTDDNCWRLLCLVWSKRLRKFLKVNWLDVCYGNPRTASIGTYIPKFPTI